MAVRAAPSVASASPERGLRFGAVAAEELGGQVLGQRHAASVAGGQQPPAVVEDGGQVGAPCFEVGQLAADAGERLVEGGEM